MIYDWFAAKQQQSNVLLTHLSIVINLSGALRSLCRIIKACYVFTNTKDVICPKNRILEISNLTCLATDTQQCPICLKIQTILARNQELG